MRQCSTVQLSLFLIPVAPVGLFLCGIPLERSHGPRLVAVVALLPAYECVAAAINCQKPCCRTDRTFLRLWRNRFACCCQSGHPVQWLDRLEWKQYLIEAADQGRRTGMSRPISLVVRKRTFSSDYSVAAHEVCLARSFCNAAITRRRPWLRTSFCSRSCTAWASSNAHHILDGTHLHMHRLRGKAQDAGTWRTEELATSRAPCMWLACSSQPKITVALCLTSARSLPEPRNDRASTLAPVPGWNRRDIHLGRLRAP